MEQFGHCFRLPAGDVDQQVVPQNVLDRLVESLGLLATIPVQCIDDGDLRAAESRHPGDLAEVVAFGFGLHGVDQPLELGLGPVQTVELVELLILVPGDAVQMLDVLQGVADLLRRQRPPRPVGAGLVRVDRDADRLLADRLVGHRETAAEEPLGDLDIDHVLRASVGIQAESQFLATAMHDLRDVRVRHHSPKVVKRTAGKRVDADHP